MGEQSGLPERGEDTMGHDDAHLPADPSPGTGAVVLLGSSRRGTDEHATERVLMLAVIHR